MRSTPFSSLLPVLGNISLYVFALVGEKELFVVVVFNFHVLGEVEQFFRHV